MADKENKVVDALSCCKHLLTSMFVTVLGFEEIRQPCTLKIKILAASTSISLMPSKLNIRTSVFMMAICFKEQNSAYQLPPSVNILCRNYMLVDVVDT